MCKSAECSARTVAGVLDVVALCGFVDFGMELLLRPRVTVLAGVAGLTGHGIAPLVPGFHLRTGRGSAEKIKREKNYG